MHEAFPSVSGNMCVYCLNRKQTPACWVRVVCVCVSVCVTLGSTLTLSDPNMDGFTLQVY